MTTEERQFITKKIKHAYQRKTPTYEELLDTCCAIEEEFIFMVAPSRLDYFKSGVQYEKRIVGKLTNLRRCAAAIKSEEPNQIDESARSVKRMKTQHWASRFQFTWRLMNKSNNDVAVNNVAFTFCTSYFHLYSILYKQPFFYLIFFIYVYYFFNIFVTLPS